jgi:hypothetical protein
MDTVPTLPDITPDGALPPLDEPAPPSPITGLWSFYNAPFPFECAGFGTVMVVGSETCTARMTVSADRQTLTGEPESCDGDSGSIFGPPGLPNQASPSGGTNASMALMQDGTYRLALDLTPMGMAGSMTFVFDFISDTEMTGYLEGAMTVDGVSCSMRRETTATRVGD